MAESLPQAGQAPPTYQSVIQQQPQPGQPQYPGAPGAPGMGGQLQPPPPQDIQQQPQGGYNPQMGGSSPSCGRTTTSIPTVSATSFPSAPK